MVVANLLYHLHPYLQMAAGLAAVRALAGAVAQVVAATLVAEQVGEAEAIVVAAN